METKWKQFNLIDLVTISTKKVGIFDGEKEYVATGDIDGDQIVSNQIVTYANKPSRADLLLSQRDVLFAKMRGTIKVLIGKKEYEDKIFSTGFYVITPKENVSLDFIYFFLISKEFNLQKDSYCTGATMSAITNDGLKKIKIRLPINKNSEPNIEEQNHIASLLKEAKDVKNKRLKANQKIVGLTPALFDSFFGDPDNNEKHWKIENLGVVCKTIYRYPTFYGFKYEERGIPVVKIGNILQNGIVDPQISNYTFISSDINNKFPKTILELYDILMAVRGDGSTGKRIGIVLSDSLIGANMSPNLLRFKTNEEILNPIYLFHLMISRGGQSLIDRRITRTSKKTITSKDINLIEIPIPPIELQNKFAELVKEIELQKNKQKESTQKIDELFDAIMAKSFA